MGRRRDRFAEPRIVGDRRGSRRRGVALLVVIGLAVTASVVLRAQVPQAEAQITPPFSPQPPQGCTSTTSKAPLLLPAWSDQSGWSAASQYEAIRTADIDGDGTSELIGRNAGSLDVQDWGQPFQAAAVADPGTSVSGLPAPGQWVPDLATPPAAAEQTYFDPSTYSTLQAANFDSDVAEELFARTYGGLQVFDFTPGAGGAPGSWTSNTYANVFADAWSGGPWWQAPYYSTITHGDVNGDNVDEVIGRGPNGIQTWQLQGGAFVQIDASSPPVMPDASSWNQPQYYETIRVGDVTGDNRDDLVARSETGLWVWSFAGGTWTQQAGNGPWPDAQGQWKTNPSWYSTIQLGDLSGDGVLDVYARTQYGIDAWTDKGGTWSELLTTPPSASNPTVVTDAQGFNAGAAYYGTIQTAELNGPSGPDLILARSSAGVGFYQLSGNQLVGPTLTASQFSDTNGWNQPVRYETISTATVAPGVVALLGKDATGMRTCQLSGTTWTSPSAQFPPWTAATANPDDPPPGYDPTLWQQQVNAWTYINQQCQVAPQSFCSPVVPTPTALFDLVLSDQTSLLPASPTIGVGDSKVLNWYVNELDPPAGLNIPSDVWDSVYGQGLTWLYEIANVQNLYFGTTNGGNLQQLILAVQLTNNTPSSLADAYFGGSNQQVKAFVADLLRAATVLVGFASGTAESLMYLVGASVAAGSALDNPLGEIDTTAAQLQVALNDQFDDSAGFLASSYLQIVQDAGLLGAMGQMTIQGPLLFTDGFGSYQPIGGSIPFTQAAKAAQNQSQLWVWQQLASSGGGWTVGYCSAVIFEVQQEGQCPSGLNSDVNSGNGKAYLSGLVLCPGNDPDGDQCYVGYKYRVAAGSTCDSSSKGGQGYQALLQQNIGFDPDQLFMPRQQAARLPSLQADPKGYQLALPIDAQGAPSSSGTMGILGWRVPPDDCTK